VVFRSLETSKQQRKLTVAYLLSPGQHHPILGTDSADASRLHLAAGGGHETGSFMLHHMRTASVTGLVIAALSYPTYAAENGTGFYLLGSRGPAAAIMPPSGIYFQKPFYFYSGELGGGKQLPTGGKLAAGVRGDVFFTAPTVLWVAPEEILGGKLGLTAITPIGWMKSSADVTFDGPLLGHREASISDQVFAYGDPVVGGMLGWESGNFHYQFGTSINVPIGDYQKGEIANLAFHRWAADVYGAATYLDPATGWDFSGVLGLTFNGENPATDYKTGTEFHYEGAITKHFNQQFSAGIVGYYYHQVTGDSGDGATLGDFKGQVAALGASVGYNFLVGQTPVATELKFYHEFAAENRAEGNAIFATITIPLSITTPTMP
jgi:hypothetical protein